MSALDQMLFNMLAKNMPPEFAQFMTPEGMEKLGVAVGQIVHDFKEQQNAITHALAVVLKQQEEILNVLRTTPNVAAIPIAHVEHGNGCNGDTGGDPGTGGSSDRASRPSGGRKRSNSGANSDSGGGGADGGGSD